MTLFAIKIVLFSYKMTTFASEIKTNDIIQRIYTPK